MTSLDKRILRQQTRAKLQEVFNLAKNDKEFFLILTYCNQVCANELSRFEDIVEE